MTELAYDTSNHLTRLLIPVMQGLRDTSRGHIELVCADDAVLRQHAMVELRRLVNGQYCVFDFDYTQSEVLSLGRYCRQVAAESSVKSPVCVIATGLEQLKVNDPDRYQSALNLLNQHREDIIQSKTAAVLWLTSDTYADVLAQAPDFADWGSKAILEVTEETAELLREATRYEKMLAKPNLGKALSEEFNKQLSIINHRLAQIRTTASQAGQKEEFQYDAFLSYAAADAEFAQWLAIRLQDSGVSVWFDKWQRERHAPDADNPNEGLRRSNKMVAVWSEAYFRDSQVWTLAGVFARQFGQRLALDRPIVAALISGEQKMIPDTLAEVVPLDFRIPEDREFRVRQVVEALEIVRDETKSADTKNEDLVERDPSLRGLRSQAKGRLFEDRVAEVYRLLGFDVKQDVKISGVQLDLLIEQRFGGFRTQAVVECKDKRVAADDRDQILAQQNVVQRANPRLRWVTVSAQGFAADTRTALESAGVDCITYSELMRELVPLEDYAAGLIADYNHYRAERWEGNDWFIRPEVAKDLTYDKLAALEFLGGWLGDTRSNELVILGDLGSGKSTLMSFLAYQLAQSFLSDPLRHPAPVLVPLGEVRKKLDFDSIITHHLSGKGLRDVRVSAFEHLVRNGKIILLFDGFDEMADRVQWSVTEDNFNALLKPAGGKAKIIITCRTHYFKNRREQVRLVGEAPRLSESETALYTNLRQRAGAQVAYLEEFDDARIKTYLEKVRGKASVAADWEKIQRIHNLKDLATRPLLLDMIVKSLPQLDAGQQINAANLYTVYTNLWVQRERDKRREILDSRERLELMKELAWRMWRDEKEKEGVDYRQLEDFITELMRGKVLDIQDAEPETVVREMQSATFINRGKDSAHFKFMHRSFMEFFLARKLHEALTADTPQLNWLDTRRFDQKVVYFLTLLDEQDELVEPMRRILAGPYQRNVSENALQILYWGGRVRADMEAELSTKPAELAKLRSELAGRFPPNAQLAGARLQEIELLHAQLAGADFTAADLTKAKFDHADLTEARLSEADLTEASLANVVAERADFGRATLDQAVFSAARLAEADFTQATGYAADKFADADLTRARGLTGVSGKINLTKLLPVAQKFITGYGSSFFWKDFPVAFSPDGELLAIGAPNGNIFICKVSDLTILRTLAGHTASVLSVAFSPDGQTLASASDDDSVRLWSPDDGRSLRTLAGHTASVLSVAFSPDGQTLASASSDKSVRLWSPDDGRSLRTLAGHTASVWSVAFSPDGQTLASASDDNSVRLWSPDDGRSLRTLAGHTAREFSEAKSPEGQTLASASDDKSVRLWSPDDGECLAVLGWADGNSISPTPDATEGGIRSVAFAPSGGFVCGGGWAGRLQIWDLQTCKTALLIYNFGEEWLMLLPDGRFDVSSPEALRYLRYTEIGTFNSYRAEDLAKEFHSPDAVKALLAKFQKR